MTFKTWGTDHLAVLALMLLACAVMIRRAGSLRQHPLQAGVRACIAFFILVAATGDQLQQWHRGHYVLPLQLCDLALILAVLAWLFPQNKRAGELSILWALSGSVQAVLTPDLSEGFPSIPWIFFFGTHAAVILSAVYFLCSGQVKLSGASVWRGGFWILAYAAAIGLINGWFHYNYGYLAAKPAHASLLDYFGPWPYYIGAEGLLALGFFFLIMRFGRWIDKTAV